MKKTNKILAIFLAILMVMYFVPFTSFKVLAVPANKTITFLGSPTIDEANGTVTYTIGGEQYEFKIGTGDPGFIPGPVTGDTITFNATNREAVIQGDDSQIDDYYIFLSSGVDTKIIVNGNNLNQGKVAITSSNMTFNVEENNNTGGGGNNPSNPQPGGTDSIEFDIAFTNTNMNVQINGIRVMDDRNGPQSSFEGTIQNAGSTNPNDTNILTFEPPFQDKPAESYNINGTEYGKDSPEVLLYDDQTGKIEIQVPGAAKYIIRGTANVNFVTPLTVIWVNPDYVPTDPANAQWVKDFTIDHGYARAIEVYDENNTKLNPRDYINTTVQPDGSSSDEYGLNKGFGWVKVMPGSRVIFEFVPDYGYQLTSISINERPLEAIDASTNRFEVVLPLVSQGSGNIHFAATFTKTDDIVKAESTKVSSGSIELGNTLSGGTAQLVVDDVDLSSDKITAFTNAAGDYRISNYLDINLNQVFYKGKADSDDVWSNEITELENEATITLKLEDGVNGNEVVIVHEKHDGTYEIIPCTYDATTNTITFKTSSFSNYAIASKTVETTNPKTGDSIMMYTAIFALAILGTVGVVKVRKNLKK